MKRNIRLKAAVLEKFRHQFEFCQKSGIREDRLSRFISGRSVPSEEEKQVIALELQKDPEELFSNEA